MKVKALTNIKYGADWRFSGEVFEIPDGELEGMKELVEPAAKTAAPKVPEDPEVPDETPAEEKPKRTGTRRRKE